MREHEWKWSRRNRSCAIIWSKFSVQLPWTTSSPPVKGDYHVWSDVKYLDQIWYMASLDPLGSTLQGRKLCLIYFLFYWVDRERGGSNCNLKFWIVKWENMSESGPAGIEVVRIFGPNLVCSCLGPQLVHLWKGTTMFGLILAEYDMAQWCVE